MGIYLNPDNEGFSTSVRSKIYIDKTGLIDYMNQILDSGREVMQQSIIKGIGLCSKQGQRSWKER